MLRASAEGHRRNSTRNVRVANELMRAAAGQGQNQGRQHPRTYEASRTAAAVTLQGALMQKTEQRSAFRAVNAALCGRAMRARLVIAADFLRGEEAPALSAGCRQNAPPGS
jgi:hypothetical protein